MSFLSAAIEAMGQAFKNATGRLRKLIGAFGKNTPPAACRPNTWRWRVSVWPLIQRFKFYGRRNGRCVAGCGAPKFKLCPKHYGVLQ